ELRRALGLAPRGGGLALDLTAKLIDVFRRAKRLEDAVAYCEGVWPKPMRRVVEWTTLGGLYDETGATDDAIGAFEAVVAMAPYELNAQRKLLRLLVDMNRLDDAIARYEMLAREFPREASF